MFSSGPVYTYNSSYGSDLMVVDLYISPTRDEPRFSLILGSVNTNLAKIMVTLKVDVIVNSS